MPIVEKQAILKKKNEKKYEIKVDPDDPEQIMEIWIRDITFFDVQKAAQNMFIKTMAIECKQRSRETICVGLHPGTVDTRLSKPFTKRYPKEKLFTPKAIRCETMTSGNFI